jgi:AcrR family transcriptional regulator
VVVSGTAASPAVEIPIDFDRRREEIIATAATVFHAKGYHAGSLADVAAALDPGGPELEHYVSSKEHLLYLIFDRAISLALRRLDELATIADPRRRIGAFIAHQVLIVTEEPSMFTVFFESRPRLDAGYEDRIHGKEKAYLQRFVDVVTAGVEAGVLPPVNPRFGAQALLGMSSWIYKWYDPAQDDWAALADDFVALVLHREAHQ